MIRWSTLRKENTRKLLRHKRLQKVIKTMNIKYVFVRDEKVAKKLPSVLWERSEPAIIHACYVPKREAWLYYEKDNGDMGTCKVDL